MALGGWRARSLTAAGALAATLVGTLILTGTGWPGGLVLGVFFIGSTGIESLLERRGSRVARRGSAGDSRLETRDPHQVLANGGPAALAALLGFDHPSLALWIVTASLAAAAADTWATSIGARSATPPRLLVSGRVVAPGTSGGVTAIGTMGGLVGAALVAAAGSLAGGGGARVFVSGTLIGFAGMLVDSVLGGTLQGRFHCTRCGVQSEWRRHRCGEATVHREGIAWLNNDAVNLAATSLAAVAGAAAWSSWAP